MITKLLKGKEKWTSDGGASKLLQNKWPEHNRFDLCHRQQDGNQRLCRWGPVTVCGGIGTSRLKTDHQAAIQGTGSNHCYCCNCLTTPTKPGTGHKILEFSATTLKTNSQHSKLEIRHQNANKEKTYMLWPCLSVR